MVTDDDLVRRFQRGDEVAFSVFVGRHQDRLYRLARLWLADAQDAQDVVQEVLMRSYTGLKRFAFRAQPTTWLVRTTRNVCHEFNRRRRLSKLADRFGSFDGFISNDELAKLREDVS